MNIGKNPVNFSAIVFDFDGVIADSEIIANTALARLLTELGLRTTLEEALRDYCGNDLSIVSRLSNSDWE